MFIVSLTELKMELGITDNAEDALILLWGTGIEARFEEYLRRQLLFSSAATEILDGGTSCLYLKRYPLSSIATIHVDPDQAWDDAGLLDSDDYAIDYRQGQILYGRGASPWPAGFQNCRVVYAGGMFLSNGAAASSWVEQSQVDNVRRAMFMQGGYEWRNRTMLGIEQISAGSLTKKAPAKLLPEVIEVLNPLRKVV
jgi:hypothetical protein